MGQDAKRTLCAELESAIPRVIPVGRGTALFVHGWCFHPLQPVRSLALVAGGEEHRLDAQSMPRADVFRRADPAAAERAYRSGFWGLLPLAAPAREGEPVAVELVARLADGSTERVTLAEPTLTTRASDTTPAQAGAAPSAVPLVVICMATYNPRPDLLERQLDSIRAQTHTNWHCLISDDQSLPDAYGAVQEAIAGDDRFVLTQAERRLGYYHNFERALTQVPAEAD